MPASYQIDTANRLIVIKLSEKITEQEIINDRERLAADPQFDPTFSQLIDLRNAWQVESPTATINKLAQSSLFKAGVKKAIIAHDDLAFGLSRMYELLSLDLNQQTMIFHEIDKALEWLGISTTIDLK
jgi:hypothetical protein